MPDALHPKTKTQASKWGKKIKRARVKKGLTQAEAAKMAGMCRATLISVEQGKAIPRWDKMERLLKVVGAK